MTDETYNYRKLVLWQKAQELALEVVNLVGKLPSDRVAPVLGRQVLRSASSIGANVAEGHGRFSFAAHRNHLSIAKGSACETDGWLDLLRRSGYLEDVDEERLHSACQEIIRMLTAKILDLQRREAASGKRVREQPEPYIADAPGAVDQLGSRF
jgi:four helix bundle protein